MADSYLFVYGTFLFVYGTLRRDCTTGAHQRYLAGAEFIAKARVRGRLYRVSYYPALVIDESGDWVKGEIYRLKDAAQLSALDEYEECSYPATPDQEYQRITVFANADNEKEIACWVYAYQQTPDGLAVIESGDFLNP
ncbi:gamma-glutamylcyclotransferase [Cellvibrio sp. pealriver]|uniref:gamma-glutamylcyclotransferase family protein n=1 Tax=Cellvibrio sp. pealriver TaxID=1622269 RepID=UPI00066FDF4D|nr:gamma-glutamylcyclotransferase family protein [Cellvibrio sp. pealriver]